MRLFEKIRWILLLLVVNPLLAQNYFDKSAIHGMLLMGKETIYASHLPMFHSPHDYQIILTLKFDAGGNKKYHEDREAHPEELVYTIEPEKFVLPKMVNKTKRFKAAVYRGHFERGGVMIAKDVDVTIKEVIYMNQLKKKGTRPTLLRYLLFGNDKEQFLAHVISARPDFDEIIEVKTKSKEVFMLKDSFYKILEFNESDKRKAFSWKTNSAKLGQDRIVFSEHKSLYFELGDLE